MGFSPDTPLIECVPNFSEGRDADVIRQITAAIEAVEGVALLDVDPGKATNRTVVTFVGTPDAVAEAAFRAIARASELIDMRHHHGEHPRMGATDVCPFVPVANATMEDCIAVAHKVGKRVGEELGLSGYFYEQAAASPQRRNLADVRHGEYEGLAQRITTDEWRPDFGPAEFNPRFGAVAVGAREFLVAYNVNLNTTSTRRANAVAFDVREKGRPLLSGDPLTGKPVLDDHGEPVWQPGKLKAVKGIGWFIEEYGIAQVSLNLTNIRETPVHVAFEACCEAAAARGLRVTGSELVGLIPLQAMLDAGRYFLARQQRSLGVSEEEIVKIAVKSLGLDDLTPFDPAKKIIEYRLRDAADQPLIHMRLNQFADTAASEAPAPGGGSVSAYVGALGAALGTMVANLSSHKRGWDDRWEEFSRWAEQGQVIKDTLLRLVDDDTHAYNRLLEAFRLPQGSAEEKAARSQAIQTATKGAIDVPFRVMQQALASMDVLRAMVQHGMTSSISDAGVGALCARTAVMGAYLNVRINTSGVKDAAYVEEKLRLGLQMVEEAQRREAEILEGVNGKIA